MPKKAKSNDVVKAVVLYNNCEIGEFKIPTSCDVDRLDINKFPSNVLQVLGKDLLERECDFSYLDNTISIFAWSNGKAGNENKHDLPPPIDKNLYFGNIFVILHKNGKVKNLSQNQYTEFYELAFGGFETICSSDSWSTEEELNSNDSLNDFIVEDNLSDETFNTINSSEDNSLSSGSDTTPTDITMSSSDSEK